MYERFENVLICIIYIGSEGPFRPISNFPFFCQNKNSLELFNIIFENSSPKGFFWANKKKFEFSALSPDSRKLLTTPLKMLRTMIFLYEPNFGFIYILQAKNIANKQFIPDYSLDPGLKLLESVSSEENSWIGFSRRLSKSSNLHISVHFKPFAGQLQIERWHDLVQDEDSSSSMAVSTGSPFIQ